MSISVLDCGCMAQGQDRHKKVIWSIVKINVCVSLRLSGQPQAEPVSALEGSQGCLDGQEQYCPATPDPYHLSQTISGM